MNNLEDPSFEAQKEFSKLFEEDTEKPTDFPIENKDIAPNWKTRGRFKSSTFKNSRWSSNEDKKLFIALEKSLDVRGLKFDECIQDLLSGKRRKDFRGIWEEVALELPRRTMISIYDHVRTRFNKEINSGFWDSKEIEMLKQLVGKYGHNWKIISEKMGRLRVSCRDKYRVIQRQSQYRTGAWSSEEEEMLKMLLLKFKDEPKFPWTVISTMMGTRSAEQVVSLSM